MKDLMKKLKPRDFKANPKVLDKLNIGNYDMQEDLNQLQINVEEIIMQDFKTKWKTMDEVKLKYLIRK